MQCYPEDQFIASADNDRQITATARDLRKAGLRIRVVSVLPAGSELPPSIPGITPGARLRPGPGGGSGMWSVADTIGVLNWTASTNPLLDHCCVRTAPGPA